MFRRHFVVLLACCATVGLTVSCSPGQQSSRVVLLGIDGLDPEAIDLLMSEGDLPNFARLRQEGAYGKLRASPPLLSPVLWTTMATGKPPVEHGIGHFVAVDQSTGEELPVTSAMRRVKALWNIASEAGREVATVGWWATWPPEPVNGVVVSDHTCYHFLFKAGETGDPSRAFTYPPELAGEIAPLIQRPTDISHQEARRYMDVAPEAFSGDFDFSDQVSHFRWALATAHSYRDIGLHLWRERRPDLLMVYIEGTDSISHLFGHLFRADGLAGELAEQQRHFGKAAEEVYRYADELLGHYLEALDDDTTLLVMSDHGFKLGELLDDPSRTRDMRRVTELQHRELGILYIWGKQVKRHARLQGATQLDITPTVLTLLGLDVARDMPGRVLTEALDIPAPGRSIPTYETGRATTATVAGGSAVDDQIKAHLRSLGYIEGQTASPSGMSNLAAVHFEEGRPEEAAAIYRELVEADPTDASLHASLAGCLGALQRYQEALAALDRSLELDPMRIEAYHNRAVIHERLGNLEEAAADYRNALRYRPDYEPSQEALIRLTGSAGVRAPTDERELRAAQLCSQASDAARRGAYDEAMSLLDEAERAAPHYVLVQQYQSNVAYLMQDYQRAERALLRALEVEPDNALFRKNLEQVRRKKKEAGQ